MRSVRITASPVTVFFVFLLVYLCTLTSNFTGPHDSMAYLNMLKTGEGLWHPHHLLYHVLSKYWLNFWKLFFPSTPDYLLVESFSSLWGAAVVALVFIFFRRRFNFSVLSAWLGTMIVGFSYGIWFYSVNVEVYMPALFFTILSLYILTKKDWRSGQLWRIAIVHSLAILFHQMNILLVPVVIYKIIEQRKNIFVFKSIFWYGVTGLVLVGGMYFVGGWIIEGHNNFNAWTNWIRGYTDTGQYWQPLSWKTPVLASMGFSRTIIGGQFLFQLADTQQSLSKFLSTHELQDEVFLVRNLSNGSVWVILILAVLLAALIIWLIIRFISRFGQNMRAWKPVMVPLLLYMLVYAAYFFFWMPEILEFWLGHCITAWLLLIGTYQPAGRKLNILAGSIAVLLIVINYTSSIGPMQHIGNDIGYARIEKVRQLATAKDVVVVEDPWLLKEFLEYYTKGKVEVVPEASQQNALRQRIGSALASGHKVFLFPASGPAHGVVNNGFVDGLKKEYAGRVKVLEEKLAVIYVIE